MFIGGTAGRMPLGAWVMAVASALSVASACGSDDDGGGGAGAVSSSGSGASTTGGGGSSTGGSSTGGSSTGGSSTGGGGSGGGGACGDIATFEDGLQPASEIHVAPGGSDQTGDGSPGSPYASIEHAAGLAAPGTAVRIHEGSYPGGDYLSDLHGEPGAPVWIGGAPGESRPILQGGGEGLHLTRVSYLVLHDLEITGASANGINCDDGGEYDNDTATHNVVFRGLSIHDIGAGGNEDCLKLSGVNSFWVLDSEMTACGGGASGSGIDMVGCHQGTIARNSLHDLSANAVQAKGGTADVTIARNHLVNAGERGVNMGGSTGFTFFRPPLSTTDPNAEARSIRVVANVIEGGVASLAFVGCVDCLAANNTIVDPDNWIIRILQETVSGGGYTFLPASQGRFINNLVYFDRSALSTYLNIGPDTDPASFVFDSNLWYAHDDPGQSQPNLPVSEQNGVVGQDPAFASGYTIDGASPAAGAGIDDAHVIADYLGNCYASPPSIGAYEVP